MVRREAYTLLLEQARPELTFIHCDVYGKWSKATKLQLSQDWQTLKSLHGGPLYALHDLEDHKHLKFLQLFGFHKVTEFVSAADGRPYHIFSTQGPPDHG